MFSIAARLLPAPVQRLIPDTVYPAALKGKWQPESRQPENQKPKSQQPVSRKPKSRKPKSRKLKSHKSDNSKPDTSKPNTSKSDTSKPDISKSDTSKFETRPPVSQLPVSQTPVSYMPVSQMPVSQTPVSHVPVSHVPVSQMPVSQMPVSQIPVRRLPVNCELMVQADNAATTAVTAQDQKRSTVAHAFANGRQLVGIVATEAAIPKAPPEDSDIDWKSGSQGLLPPSAAKTLLQRHQEPVNGLTLTHRA